jgi:anti-sigma B factor antagonist
MESFDRPDGTRVLILHGALTLQSMTEFQEAARNTEAAGLIVDLADVPYIDSAGLGAILGAFAHCQRNGRKFGLIHVSDRVRRIFHIAKVEKILPVE